MTPPLIAILTVRFSQNVTKCGLQLRVAKLKAPAYQPHWRDALATQQQSFTHLPKH